MSYRFGRGGASCASPFLFPVFVYHCDMDVITIPKKLAQKGDLVMIPRKEYEILVSRQPRVIRVVRLTPAERRAIKKSKEELARGEYVTIDELVHESGGSRS